MSLIAVVTKEAHAKLETGVGALYKEAEGGKHFVLDVTAAEGLELTNAGTLRTELVGERQKVADATKKLETFKGIEDPAAALEALGKVGELADWDPEKKLEEAKKAYEQQLDAKYESQAKQLGDKHTAEVSAFGERVTSLTSQLSTTLIDAAATAAIVEQKGSVELLKPVVKSMVRGKVTDHGKFIVEVIGDDGLARLTTKPGSTEPMAISELVTELRGTDAFARAFDGSGATGSGARQSASGAGASGASINLTYEQAQDPALYRAAKEQAEKEGKPLGIADPPMAPSVPSQ